MRSVHHIQHHERHHYRYRYPSSVAHAIYAFLLGPILVLLLIILGFEFFGFPPTLTESISLQTLILATLATVTRIILAYVIAVLLAIPLALLTTANSFTEAILLPLFDIIESIPVLAFFPILILIFIRYNSLNGAAIFIIMLSMIWNIVFTLVGGLKIIPRDIKFAAKVFNLRGFAYFNKVLLPAIFPQFVTGSILAVAQGWNIIIVAEVLHVYIPNGSQTQDLFGIGSILVQAAGQNHMDIFISAVIIMVAVIAFINFFVWQKLLKYAQRFRFD